MTFDFYAEPGADLPLWWVTRPAMPLEELPLSHELREHLRRWHTQFQALPTTERRPEDFDNQGRELLARVRNELGSSWQVVSSWYDEDAQVLASDLDDTRRPSLPAQFERYPANTRHEVWRLAKLGRHHPDPAVATAAQAWAQTYRPGGDVLGGFALSMLLGLITAGTGDTAGGEAISRWRLAKRLRALPRLTE